MALCLNNCGRAVSVKVGQRLGTRLSWRQLSHASRASVHQLDSVSISRLWSFVRRNCLEQVEHWETHKPTTLTLILGTLHFISSLSCPSMIPGTDSSLLPRHPNWMQKRNRNLHIMTIIHVCALEKCAVIHICAVGKCWWGSSWAVFEPEQMLTLSIVLILFGLLWLELALQGFFLILFKMPSKSEATELSQKFKP